MSRNPASRVKSSRGTSRPSIAVSFVTGDMLALPFGPASFEVITTGYGLRNVPDLRQAIVEIHRVLVPGGRLVSLDFNRPRNGIVRSAYLVYLTAVGSALGAELVSKPPPESGKALPDRERGLAVPEAALDATSRPRAARLRWLPWHGATRWSARDTA